MIRSWRCSGALLLAVLLLAVSPALSEVSLDPHLQPGETAPRFRFYEVSTGKAESFDSVAPGIPLVIVFLETACRSCVREVLALKRIQQQVDGKRLGVIGVFLDMKDRNLKQYIRDYELSFPFAWDPEYRVAEAYGVTVAPVCFLVDPTGRIAKVYQGFRIGTEEEILRGVESLVGSDR